MSVYLRRSIHWRSTVHRLQWFNVANKLAFAQILRDIQCHTRDNFMSAHDSNWSSSTPVRHSYGIPPMYFIHGSLKDDGTDRIIVERGSIQPRWASTNVLSIFGPYLISWIIITRNSSDIRWASRWRGSMEIRVGDFLSGAGPLHASAAKPRAQTVFPFLTNIVCLPLTSLDASSAAVDRLPFYTSSNVPCTLNCCVFVVE